MKFNPRRAIAVLIPLFAIACGGGGSSTTPTSPTSPTTSTPAPTAPTLTAAQRDALAARFSSETADAFAESLNATGILTVTVAQAAGVSPMAITKEVVLLNSFTDSPPAVNCTPSGQLRFQTRYSGAIRTDDRSDHVEASGTMTYENCIIDIPGQGRFTINGTLNLTALLGKQPSGQETIRNSGQLTWRRDDGASGTCDADWTNVFVLPDMRSFRGNTGTFCGNQIAASMFFVSTLLNQRRAALTNVPPGLLPVGGGPANAVGQWEGTVNAVNPCSVNSPVGHYRWTGRITQNGNTFTLNWRDDYFELPIVKTFPTNQDFEFTITDGFDLFTLSARFNADYRSFSGNLTGRIECSATAIRSTSGTWDGRRTGP